MRESLSVLLRPALDGAVDTDTLRDAVCLYVAFARERGDRAERVMVDLKQQIRAAAGMSRDVTTPEQSLTERVIHWCIEGYYGPWNAADRDRT